MKLNLIGIDPGIVDTGMVCMAFDFDKKTLVNTGRVWSKVSTRKSQQLNVSGKFLAEMVSFRHSLPEAITLTYIEGFRNRGRDTYQDQTMSVLVQEIARHLTGSKIVDNTGVKKVVKKPLLELLQVARWPKTNHADLLSASRIALKGAIEEREWNKLLSSVIIEQHEEQVWDISSTLTGV